METPPVSLSRIETIIVRENDLEYGAIDARWSSFLLSSSWSSPTCLRSASISDDSEASLVAMARKLRMDELKEQGRRTTRDGTHLLANLLQANESMWHENSPGRTREISLSEAWR